MAAARVERSVHILGRGTQLREREGLSLREREMLSEITSVSGVRDGCVPEVCEEGEVPSPR